MSFTFSAILLSILAYASFLLFVSSILASIKPSSLLFMLVSNKSESVIIEARVKEICVNAGSKPLSDFSVYYFLIYLLRLLYF